MRTMPGTIETLRALRAKATPGPWEVHPNERYWILLPDDYERTPPYKDMNRDANAALVAATVNALPDLLDDLDALRAKLAEQDRLSDEVVSPALDAATDEVTRLRAEVEGHATQVHALMQDIAALNAKVARLRAETGERVARWASTVAERDDRIAALEALRNRLKAVPLPPDPVAAERARIVARIRGEAAAFGDDDLALSLDARHARDELHRMADLLESEAP